MAAFVRPPYTHTHQNSPTKAAFSRPPNQCSQAAFGRPPANDWTRGNCFVLSFVNALLPLLTTFVSYRPTSVSMDSFPRAYFLDTWGPGVHIFGFHKALSTPFNTFLSQKSSRRWTESSIQRVSAQKSGALGRSTKYVTQVTKF